MMANRNSFKKGKNYKVYLGGQVYCGAKLIYTIINQNCIDYLFDMKTDTVKRKKAFDFILEGGENFILQEIEKQENGDDELVDVLQKNKSIDFKNVGDDLFYTMETERKLKFLIKYINTGNEKIPVNDFKQYKNLTIFESLLFILKKLKEIDDK